MVMSATKLAVPNEERDTVLHAATEIGQAAFSSGEIIIHDESGRRLALPLTTAMVEAISTVFARLGEGEDVVLLGEEKELTPEQAAKVLGVSRPLVYHRMDTGRLPYRMVGSHRRVKLRDVLSLASFEERRQVFARELAEDTDDQELARRGP